MNILLAIDSLLPDTRQGEAERVVWYLAKELDRLGHRVTLLVHRGSHCGFAHIIYRDYSQPVESQIPGDIDIVHLHLNGGQVPQISKPHIITQYHTSPTEVDNTRTIYLSQDHARRNGSSHFVYSGLDWAEYGRISLSSTRRYYHFFATRLSQASCDFREAVDIVRGVNGAKLCVVGKGRSSYLRELQIALSRRLRFSRAVDEEQRARLMLSSKGLIFNARHAEPFGLDIIESLFFGAPVFGSRVGSLPEIVGREFGYLSDDPQQIAQSMQELEFSPYRCHQYAMDCFNSQIMAAQYLKKYTVILTNNQL